MPKLRILTTPAQLVCQGTTSIHNNTLKVDTMQFKENELERILMSLFYYLDRFKENEEVTEEVSSVIRKVRAYKDNYSV